MRIVSVIITIVLVFFVFFKPALSLSNKEQKMRIIDIMVIGSIASFVPILTEGNSFIFTLRIIGGLIFFYGFFLIIIDNFKEGYNSKSRSK